MNMQYPIPVYPKKKGLPSLLRREWFGSVVLMPGWTPC